MYSKGGGKNKAGRLIPALLAVLLLALTGAPAQAGADPAQEETYTLPAVTVTADKRETEAQKTPMALTVITAQQLEDAGMASIHDVLVRVPNLGVNPWFGGTTNMSFRGAMTATGTNANPLIIYIDGVPADTLMNLDASLLNIERVEILRGTQGVVYGKNSLGGIINIISKKPGNTYEGAITGKYGSYDTRSLGATVSGPLKEDRLFFSLSVQHNYSGGWMESKNTSEKNALERNRAKGQLLFTPSEKAEFAFHFDYTKGYDGFSPYGLGNSYPSKSEAFSSDRSKMEILNLGLKGSVHFDALSLESVTTFRSESTQWRWNMFPIEPSIWDSGRDANRKEITQEVRLRSPDGQEGFAWLAGAFFSYADYHINKMYMDYVPIPIMPGLTLSPSMNQTYREYTKEYAPFAQVELPVSDSFTITAGLRWHYTERKGALGMHINADGKLLGFTDSHSRLKEDWSEFLPRLNFSYRLTDDHMLYAGVSRSFLPGGFNYASTSGVDAVYDAQTAWNYEIGAKTNWLDKRLSVNLALFYSDFKDLQIMQLDPAINAYVADNAGRAESYGAELDLLARLTKELDLEMSFGYTHARFTDYKADYAGGRHDFDNNKVPFTPKFTGNLALQYRHDSGFFARTEAHYFGKLYWNPDNENSRNDVVTVDARVGWETDHADIYFYGTNIFGARYLHMYTNQTNLGLAAPPQEFGVQFAFRF